MMAGASFIKYLIVFTLVLSFDRMLTVRGRRKVKTRQRSLKNLNELQGQFVWQAGKWKVCQKGTSCSEPGFQRRSLSCLDSSRKKTYSRLCDRKLRPSRRKHCVFSACKNQTNFKLRFWPWSSCESYPLIGISNVYNGNSTLDNRDSKGFSNANYPNYILESNWRNRVVDTCGSPQHTIVFVKKRNISCMAHWPNKNILAEVAIDNCFLGSERRPRTVQLCSFGCRQKCVVTLWSGWKSCASCRKKIIYRQRKIAFFQSKNNSTDKCPTLLQVNTAKTLSNSTSENLYQIRTSEWSSCKTSHSRLRRFSNFLSNKTGIVGFRKRSLDCVNEKGKLVKCDDEVMLGQASLEACIMPRDCQTGPWEGWSNCQNILHHGGKKLGSPEEFIRRRTRRIIKTSLSGGKPCPHLFEVRRCSPPEIPRYQQQVSNTTTFRNETFEWFAGKFGQCKSKRDDCVSGKKQRHVFCVRRGDAKFNPVGSQFCVHLDKPVEEIFCKNPCRQICILGEWGPWSGCTADCGRNSTGLIHGTHYRVRRVIQYSNDRRACEDYAESRPCKLDSCISWMAGTQTVCLMDNIHRTCGNGKTHRAVYCLNSRGNQVKDSLCKGQRPPRSLPCHVPCADDCVVGTWSDWGPCEGECGRNGTQGNSIQTRRQRILAYPGWSGRPCPSNRELRQSQSCLGTACGIYHWKAGIWSICHLKRSEMEKIRNRENQRCFLGNRNRNVSCVNESGKTVEDYLCTDFLKPSETKECYLCPEDCVLSPWSKWSSCPNRCTGLGNIDKPSRNRQRYILIPGTDGGMLCPEESSLVQVEECKNCKNYRWRYTKWTKCILAANGNCKGYKTRQVYCITLNDEVAEDGYCQDHSIKPLESMECENGCHKDCMLTDWSAWSKCSRACGTGSSQRHRNIVGNRIRCDPSLNFTEKRTCNTHNCGQYSLQIGKWSTCYAKDPNKSCSAGIQWRNITCFKISGPEAPLDYCIEELYGGELALASQRSCKVECAKDCKLSPWTAFTPCSRKCGAGVKTRFRKILQQATHGGQQCVSNGHVKQIIQTVACRVEDCFYYVWRSDAWEECKIKNQTRGQITKCGTGFHKRRVYCIDKRLSGLRSIINDSLCDALEKPDTKKSCALSCPGDCVVGYWSSWTRCSSRCPRPGHRRRERSVLRHPAHDGKSCPTLEDYQTCNVKQCYTYHWRLTQWSSCLLYQVNSSCGIGRQNRMADCSRSDGKIVHPFYCRIEGRRVPNLLRMCSVPCPKNCELSEWQTWSTCPDSCGIPAVQSRTRSILAKAENGGKSCLQSDLLQEFRACQIKPCYKVAVGEWNLCSTQIKNGCGVGTRQRSVNCIRDDGKITEDYFCPEIYSDYQRQMDCNIPCKGDCIVSEWSSWSKCFGTCSVENKTILDVGMRIRTRVVVQEAGDAGLTCAKDLVQKEKCRDPHCFTFAWKIGQYRGKTRDVWCERSDGLNVTHGCNPSQKPSATKFCQPSCSVRHSYCNSKTICSCKQSYIPILGSTGHLIHCLSDSSPSGNSSNDVEIASSSSGNKKDKSWFADLPIIIWVVIAVCFVYLLLFLAIVIVYTRRRTKIAREKRAKTADVATATNPESIPLREKTVRHERTESKTSFATSSGRGSTLSAISDHDDAEQWPEPPDDVVSEFIRHHLKNFTGGVFVQILAMIQ